MKLSEYSLAGLSSSVYFVHLLFFTSTPQSTSHWESFFSWPLYLSYSSCPKEGFSTLKSHGLILAMVIQPFGFFSSSGLKMFLCCTSSFGAFWRARKQLSVVWVWHYVAKNIPLNNCNFRQCPRSRQWARKNFWQVLKKLISQLPIKLLCLYKIKK